MKNVGDLMKRLQKMMPANVKPAFTTGEELLAWQKEQGEIRAAALADCDGNFTADLGEYLAALRVGLFLLVLDRRPLVVSRHAFAP